MGKIKKDYPPEKTTCYCVRRYDAAIAIDNQNRLLVAENSPRQQILIYNIKNKVPYDTTGKREVSTAMSVAGDYVFAVEGENRRSICLQDSNGSGSSKVQTWCRSEKRKWLD